MSYVVQASPYTKLFMRQYVAQCEAEPEFAKDTKPFEILIPRSAGSAIKLIHNKPVHTTKLIPFKKYKNDGAVVNELTKELENVVAWLTGGEDGMRSPETDIYGVVSLDVDLDVGPAMVDISLLSDKDTDESRKKAAKDTQDLYRDVMAKAKVAMKNARALADERVHKALMSTHRNLLKSYEALKAEGKGTYMPSVAEAVGAYILKDIIEKSSANRKRMVETLSKVVNDTVILS